MLDDVKANVPISYQVSQGKSVALWALTLAFKGWATTGVMNSST